jgi:hypothetical protein
VILPKKHFQTLEVGAALSRLKSNEILLLEKTLVWSELGGAEQCFFVFNFVM